MEQTDRQTDKVTTKTLTAHARRGLNNIIIFCITIIIIIIFIIELLCWHSDTEEMKP